MSAHRFSSAFIAAALGASAACGQVAPPPPGPNLYRIPFAAFPLPGDNQPSPQRLELGRLLFFDPILSANHQVACATCHKPHLAMADGLPVGAALADPAGGDLPRASPTIFNIRFQHVLFWDGRARSAEDLALQPIQNPKEMGNTIQQALQELGVAVTRRGANNTALPPRSAASGLFASLRPGEPRGNHSGDCVASITPGPPRPAVGLGTASAGTVSGCSRSAAASGMNSKCAVPGVST